MSKTNHLHYTLNDEAQHLHTAGLCLLSLALSQKKQTYELKLTEHFFGEPYYFFFSRPIACSKRAEDGLINSFRRSNQPLLKTNIC